MFLKSLVLVAATAASAPLPIPDTFQAYKAACLETQANPAAVRALATTRNWTALTTEEKDSIQPGNPDAVEGWGIGQGANRMRLSISSSTLKGGIEQGSQSTCTLSATQGNDDAFIKAYSQHLKRNPGDNSSDAGTRTVVWAVYVEGARAMHYYFAGADGSNRTSTLSVTFLKKQD